MVFAVSWRKVPGSDVTRMGMATSPPIRWAKCKTLHTTCDIKAELGGGQ
jgi:hypothetical protein